MSRLAKAVYTFEQWWAEELKKNPLLVRHSKEEAKIHWDRGVRKGLSYVRTNSGEIQ